MRLKYLLLVTITCSLIACSDDSSDELAVIPSDDEQQDEKKEENEKEDEDEVEVEVDNRKKTDEADLTEPSDSTLLWGIVSDTKGYLVEGVVVSDGYTCTVTDEGGRYEIAPNENAIQVNISLPAEYEVTLADSHPYFWQEILDEQRRYDFTLTPLSGGAEKEFNLICMADTQTQSTTHVSRFESIYIPDLKEEAKSLSSSSYGVVLGDVIWNNDSHSLENTILPMMYNDLAERLIGFPTFVVIGNHDHSYKKSKDIDAQRDFEKTFGPVNYSFNRGDAHIVCMDDIYFSSTGSYTTEFRNDQVEWVTEDLSYVPKDKLLILCVHSPLSRPGASTTKINKVLAVCDEFPSYHIMSGHIHANVNYEISDTRYEHNHGAVCGALWSGRINSEGTPNGYAVYTITGNEITNWYYKSAEYDKDYQIRLYHGEDWFMPGYENSWQFSYNSEYDVIANIWNADSKWTVDIYESGVYLGEMTRYTGRDAWASGYYMGPDGHSTGGDYDKSSVEHLYYYTLPVKSKEADVEVVATDRFGNEYRQTVFTSNETKDYPKF